MRVMIVCTCKLIRRSFSTELRWNMLPDYVKICPFSQSLSFTDEPACFLYSDMFQPKEGERFNNKSTSPVADELTQITWLGWLRTTYQHQHNGTKIWMSNRVNIHSTLLRRYSSHLLGHFKSGLVSSHTQTVQRSCRVQLVVHWWHTAAMGDSLGEGAFCSTVTGFECFGRCSQCLVWLGTPPFVVAAALLRWSKITWQEDEGFVFSSATPTKIRLTIDTLCVLPIDYNHNTTQIFVPCFPLKSNLTCRTWAVVGRDCDLMETC